MQSPWEVEKVASEKTPRIPLPLDYYQTGSIILLMASIFGAIDKQAKSNLEMTTHYPSSEYQTRLSFHRT